MSSTMVKRQNTAAQETTKNDAASLPNVGSAAGSMINASAINRSWGGGLWGSHPLGTGFSSASVSRDSKTPQELLPANKIGSEQNAKTGSGLLVDSSVLDDWTNDASARRRNPAPRSVQPVKYSEVLSSAQPNALSADPYQPSGFSTQNSSDYAARPVTVNLNSSSGSSSRPTFTSSYTGSGTSRPSEAPPTVYTKHDRQPQSIYARQQDASFNQLTDAFAAQSPVEELRNSGGFGFPSYSSVPVSRNNSLPPSRHSDGQVSESRPHTDGYQRTPAYAPDASGAYLDQAVSHPNHIIPQFGQMAFNGNPFERRNTASRGQSSSSNASMNGISFQSGPGLARLNRSDHYRGSIARENGQDFGFSTHRTFVPGEQFSMNGGPHPAVFPPAGDGLYTSKGYTERSGSLSGSESESRRDSGLSREAKANNGFHGLSTEQSIGVMDQRTRGLQDFPAFNDPRMAQFLANQLRAQYAGFYPFAPHTGAQVGAFNPYAHLPQLPQLPPLLMPGPDTPRGHRELETASGFRSVLLEDFKNNNKTNKRYELKDIYDHVVEFSGDQHGSRFIQQKLETANSDEKERIFKELQPNAIQLMTDVFGNYVIQKFFEHGDQSQKKSLASRMKGQVLTLSLQMYGCRVVQKALEHILTDQQTSLVLELEHNVLKCVKDQNGNHVIQKAIERCPPQTIRFILNAFMGQVQLLSIHPYGCRVIQRCLEHCEPGDKHVIMQELLGGMPGLIGDQYGNYVVQHVVEHGTEEDRRFVLDMVAKNLEQHSKHKFASNVVEKCLYFANESWRLDVIHKLIDGAKREGESMTLGLIRDQYGNYVIQKLLDVISNRHEYKLLTDHLQPELNRAKRTGCGKQVLSIEKKMHRFVPNQLGPVLGAQQFVSRSISTTTTPPPLTADTRSLQTSSAASLNGDANEGASNSRKSSEPRSERSFYG